MNVSLIMSITGSPSGVSIERSPVTFSITNTLGFMCLIFFANSLKSWFRSSSASRFPAILNPWQGGPPIITSSSPGSIPAVVRIPSEGISDMSPWMNSDSGWLAWKVCAEFSS